MLCFYVLIEAKKRVSGHLHDTLLLLVLRGSLPHKEVTKGLKGNIALPVEGGYKILMKEKKKKTQPLG